MCHQAAARPVLRASGDTYIMKRFLFCALALGVIGTIGWTAPRETPTPDTPLAADPRLQVDLFALSPEIVHVIGMDCDAKGRLLVIESHTHFPPKDYKGPKHDRIRVLEDTDGDGRADRFTTFFEGTTKTMDIAVHPDGWVYLATRNEVLRVRDTDGDGKADEQQRVVFLDTAGDYPHNGLSGLAFDSKGNLYFGMGENLGAGYKLIGADGTTLSGGGEGGNVFWCTADGKGLRRVATGFWNPFGVCRDVFGRLFAVDNDPDSMPPCRMVHVVEGGDYGYQFRYGRAGRHPFQCWNGQLAGTLPMLAGTGEAPVEVLAYESDGLPREYLGNLLVTAWADHRIERYVLKERGASYTAERRPFVQGSKDFRPTGLALAPDGSLFVGDWVKSDYTLHGKGAVWHVRLRDAVKPDRPRDPRRALASAHRPLRDVVARELARTEEGRTFLREQLAARDERVRAAALTALIDSGDGKTDLAAIAAKDPQVAIRAMAVRALAARGDDTARFLDAQEPGLRLEAVAGLRGKNALPHLLKLLTDTDPFLRSAAIRQLGRSPELLAAVDRRTPTDPRRRMGVLLAYRARGAPEAVCLVPEFLADPDEEVRFLAAKWVADEKLAACRPLLVEALKDRKLNVRLYSAYSTALARIDGQEVNDAKLAEYFLDRLADDRSPPALRVLALQMVPAAHPKLTPELLKRLALQDEPALRLEAVRTLAEQPGPKRVPLLRAIAADERMGDAVRAQAVLGLAEHAQEWLDDLMRLARGGNAILRDEALRALVGTKLTAAQREQLECVARRPECAALVARVLGKPPETDRPSAENVKEWLARLEGPADAAAGRRIFAHPKLAGCFRCHRVEGRGREVGPDLSTIGQTERRRILESILQPSASVAPHFQVWQIETRDGKIRAGMLVGTNLDDCTYIDNQGALFKVNTHDVVEILAVPTSIMPAGLVDLMTDQELRDLLAYLCSRR
jgi:putative membrane-bound dehydrogenase-like protein